MGGSLNNSLTLPPHIKKEVIIYEDFISIFFLDDAWYGKYCLQVRLYLFIRKGT